MTDPRKSFGEIVGNFPSETIPGKDKHYFLARDIHLDCLGTVYIHESAQLGRGVKIITASHSYLNSVTFKVKVNRMNVSLAKNSYVGSYSILYNTRIGESTVILPGTVIVGRNVAPFLMVGGNPAVVIARWEEDHWAYDRKYFGTLK